MRKIAVISTWATFALFLFSAFWLGTRAPGAVGITNLLPLVFLGAVLVAHHTKPVRAALAWVAIVLCVIWGLLGLLVTVVSLATGQPPVGWGLLIGLFGLLQGIPSAIVLYGRRNEWKTAQAAS